MKPMLSIKVFNGVCTITRAGYYPILFIHNGRDVRCIKGVPLKGDHDRARKALRV